MNRDGTVLNRTVIMEAQDDFNVTLSNFGSFGSSISVKPTQYKDGTFDLAIGAEGTQSITIFRHL